MLKESLRILYDLGNRPGIAENLGRFACTVDGRDKGSHLRPPPLELGGSVRGQWRRTTMVAKRNEETLTSIRKQLDDDSLAAAWEEGRALTIDEAIALALES